MAHTNYKRTIPLVKWAGGKSRMLKTLTPIIGSIPHTCYCEPFFGGGAVMLSKPPAKHDVLNDINNNLINLYRQVQAHPDALIRELRLVQKSRHTLDQFKQQHNYHSLTEIQRAARYLYCNWFSFGGSGTSFAVQRSQGVSKKNLLKKISRVSRRLDRVSIENLDWERCILLYDSAETLFFIDPPYTAGNNKLYELWSDADLNHLHSILLKVKGNWILTINDSPESRQIFSPHHIQAIKSTYTLSKCTTGTRPKKTELIISNLPFS